MYEKNQEKRMYEHNRLLDKESIHSLALDNEACQSPHSLKETKNVNCFWIEGYALDFIPIPSKENYHLFEFSLENGDFLSFPFALEKGLDENYQKYLVAIHVKPLEKTVPADVLVKKLGLLVSTQIVDGKITYYLHDICSSKELRHLK